MPYLTEPAISPDRREIAFVSGGDGKNMELYPPPVDVAVTRQIGESLTGKDSQIGRGGA